MRRWLTFLVVMSTIITGCGGLVPSTQPEDPSTGLFGEKTGQHQVYTAVDREDYRDTEAEHGTDNETEYGLHNIGKTELKYAEGFSIDHFDNGLCLITIPESGRYLIIPEKDRVTDQTGVSAETSESGESDIPETLLNDPGITVIKKPVDNIYLASSSVMDFYDKLGCLDNVAMTSTRPSDWSLENVRDRVESGEISYIGKYSSPDYELLLNGSCGLAIENTMIYHNPEAKELIEKMGIPVLVERSSYEAHPLGRMEWIKLYGCLMDKEKEAEEYFDKKLAELNESLTGVKYDKKVLFFYITAGGYVNVRKPGDYIARMIELAGGDYALSDIGADEENALSTMNISLEDFYLKGKDADILIYNSTVDGGVRDISQLLEKSALLKDFRSVKEGNVFCTNKDMFQETTGACDMIAELSEVISGKSGDTDSMKYLHRLR
ncbi:MAG: ABC transporter substrate-binding protein [Lachnospiraceae bacterium]|nr:ABC transporter substrate-binding protein [Lachnospiraceae bacterium]